MTFAVRRTARAELLDRRGGPQMRLLHAPQTQPRDTAQQLSLRPSVPGPDGLQAADAAKICQSWPRRFVCSCRRSSHNDGIADAEVVAEPLRVGRADVDAAVTHVALALVGHRPRRAVYVVVAVVECRQPNHRPREVKLPERPPGPGCGVAVFCR